MEPSGRLPDPVAPRRRTARVRAAHWYELAPELVLGAGLTLFLIDEPDAALSSFGSTRAITIMTAGAVVWVVARLLAWRFVPWLLARVAIFTVAALAALAIVVLPAYDDTTVIEAFPGTTADVGPVTSPRSGPGATAPEPAATVAAPPGAPPPVTPAPTAPPTTAPHLPVLLRSGSFEGIDHRATGMVNIYRDVDGSNVVGLEEFDIQPGPDYDLYVVPGNDRDEIGGGVRLDDLRGNAGTQFYVVPADVDLATGEWTVLVWCQTFGVPIANSTPTEV